MIDPKRCTAPVEGGLRGVLLGPLCQAVATHETPSGRRCARHAEELRQALGKPNTLFNILAGERLSEEQLDRMIVELPKGEPPP
jgi:hypothetical protein